MELFGLVLYAMYTSIAPAIMSEQFSPACAPSASARPTTWSWRWAAPRPYLLTWLQSQGMERWFFYYVLAGAVITLITFIRMPETVGQKLR